MDKLRLVNYRLGQGIETKGTI